MGAKSCGSGAASEILTGRALRPDVLPHLRMSNAARLRGRRHMPAVRRHLLAKRVPGAAEEIPVAEQYTSMAVEQMSVPGQCNLVAAECISVVEEAVGAVEWVQAAVPTDKQEKGGENTHGRVRNSGAVRRFRKAGRLLH